MINWRGVKRALSPYIAAQQQMMESARDSDDFAAFRDERLAVPPAEPRYIRKACPAQKPFNLRLIAPVLQG